jgi:anthranilate synthase/aminodeoxychorismate synthase-like glutamine amidotransferase
MPTDVFVLDNYDSFTHNAVDLLRQLGARPRVERNDRVTVGQIARSGARGLVLSPGPGRPEDAGVSVEAVRRLGARLPILGICLGHQAIATAYGGRVVRAREPLHGSATEIRHRGEGLLAGLPDPFLAARYHSLVVDPARLGRGLVATAWSEAGEVMALRHAADPVEGVQFHPESFLTPLGPRILAAFLRRIGLVPRAPRSVVR